MAKVKRNSNKSRARKRKIKSRQKELRLRTKNYNTPIVKSESDKLADRITVESFLKTLMENDNSMSPEAREELIVRTRYDLLFDKWSVLEKV